MSNVIKFPPKGPVPPPTKGPSGPALLPVGGYVVDGLLLYSRFDRPWFWQRFLVKLVLGWNWIDYPRIPL